MACALRTLLNAVSPRPGAMPPPPRRYGSFQLPHMSCQRECKRGFFLSFGVFILCLNSPCDFGRLKVIRAA